MASSVSVPSGQIPEFTTLLYCCLVGWVDAVRIHLQANPDPGRLNAETYVDVGYLAGSFTILERVLRENKKNLLQICEILLQYGAIVTEKCINLALESTQAEELMKLLIDKLDWSKVEDIPDLVRCALRNKFVGFLNLVPVDRICADVLAAAVKHSTDLAEKLIERLGSDRKIDGRYEKVCYGKHCLESVSIGSNLWRKLIEMGFVVSEEFAGKILSELSIEDLCEFLTANSCLFVKEWINYCDRFTCLIDWMLSDLLRREIFDKAKEMISRMNIDVNSKIFADFLKFVSEITACSPTTPDEKFHTHYDFLRFLAEKGLDANKPIEAKTALDIHRRMAEMSKSHSIRASFVELLAELGAVSKS